MPIKNKIPPKNNGTLINIDDRNFVSASNKALNEYRVLPPAKYGSAKASRTKFSDFETNISVRNQFGRGDYEYFRPSEAIPTKPLDIIKTCREAYRRVGIVRNVIDLMGDFGCQGIQLSHPSPSIQKFYRGWFKKVRGKHVSERFLNLFYREGLAVVKRTTGKIKLNHEKNIRSMAKIDPDIKIGDELQIVKRTIPLRYNFLNPLSLSIVGEELSQFVGKTIYGLNISNKLKRLVDSPTEQTQILIEMLPKDIVEAIKSGQRTIPLDMERVITKYYKKDDWQGWPEPMIYAILSELFILEKMQLTDLAALDGAISQIRLWKLGDIEKGIFPTDAAVNKLAEILLSNPGGGAFDLIWGPELTVEDYSTNVHQFLGEEKYKPIMDRIYAGLGVPPTLTGASTASGFTNNYISLKTLIQRLEYGRDALREFWEQEIELVRQAMNFKQGAKVTFDSMVLSDETAEKALLIQLVDRDIISIETILEKFGEIPEFEELKLRKEKRKRKSGLMNDKTSPWHSPEKVFDLMKIALQRGVVGPEHTYLAEELPDEFLDSEVPLDKQLKNKNAPKDKKDNDGEPQQGRPFNSKDSDKRDMKDVNPVGADDKNAYFFTSLAWSRDIQGVVAEIMQPIILGQYGKKTIRELSAQQFKEMDEARFVVFCNLKPFQNVSREVIKNIILSKPRKNEKMFVLANKLKNKYVEQYGTEPCVDVLKTIRACAYSVCNQLI